MHKRKSMLMKILSLCLVFAMVFMIPATAFAASSRRTVSSYKPSSYASMLSKSSPNSIVRDELGAGIIKRIFRTVANAIFSISPSRDLYVTDVALSPETKTITEGNYFTPTLNLSPNSRAKAKTIKWESDKSYVASVKNGRIYAEFPGVATITCTVDGIYYDTVKVTVIKGETEKYKVTYYANGGTGAIPVDNKVYESGNTATILSSGNLSKKGYVFAGWNTKADGTGTAYTSGAEYKINADLTLYAQWKIITYTVKYDLDGGTGDSSDQIKTYDVALTLHDTPAKTGYTFVGWKSTEGDSYLASASYTANKGTTMIAQWIAVDINNYDYNSDTKTLIIHNDFGVTEIFCSNFFDYPKILPVETLIFGDDVSTLPDSFIDGNIHSGVVNLKNITIGKNVRTISSVNIDLEQSTNNESSVFIDCYKLETVNFNAINFEIKSNQDLLKYHNKNNVPRITLNVAGDAQLPEYMFYTEPFTVVNIAEGITNIPNSAFRNCAFLETVSLPETLISIGAFVFGGTMITDITIPDSVTTVDRYAFKDCFNLANVTVGCGVTKIDISTFDNCPSLKNITVSSDNSFYSSDECGVLFDKEKRLLLQYPGGNERTEYAIPNGVTNISDSAFKDCKNLTSITIPSGVTNISKDAFCNCYRLINITIPNTVINIADSAFKYCQRLANITIPSSVSSIGYNAFFGCDNLASIIVDENNSSYSSDEFGVLFNKDKTELIQYPVGNKRTQYEIPDSVINIGEKAFYDCVSLTNVTIPDSVANIGSGTFNDCKSLANITIPSSVSNIGYNAFFGCDNLASITVNENNSNYSSDEFGILFNKDKTELIHCPANIPTTQYEIPDNITTIDNNAFQNCKNLTNIIIPNSVTSIGDWSFAHCKSLTDIIIPNSVTSIGNWSFAYCKSLTNIIISNGVTSIGDFAFHSCNSLTNITIPDSMTQINQYAFGGCTNLTSASVPAGCVVDENAFDLTCEVIFRKLPDPVVKITYSRIGVMVTTEYPAFSVSPGTALTAEYIANVMLSDPSLGIIDVTMDSGDFTDSAELGKTYYFEISCE